MFGSKSLGGREINDLSSGSDRFIKSQGETVVTLRDFRREGSSVRLELGLRCVEPCTDVFWVVFP
jgi:hypothetical protein